MIKIITKVKLKNWRSHLESELQFSEGTNCFIGPMGSGKTTILDSICFALFGTFPQLQQKKVKLEDIVMKKPKKQQEAAIEVSFEADGGEWSVKRTVTKGKSTAELRKNGQLIEGPQPTKVTEEIEKILRVDYDLFTRAIYSEQNQLDMFLTIPKGERMKKIDQLLAIDKFEKARATIRSLINKSNLIVNEKKQFLQNMERDESFGRLELLKNELRNISENEKKFAEQLKQVRDKKMRLMQEIMFSKKQQKDLQTIEEDIRTFTVLLGQAEKDIEKLKNELVEYAEKTTDDLKKDLNDLIAGFKELQENLEEEKHEAEKIIGDYAQKEITIQDIEARRIPELENFLEERNKILLKLKRNPPEKIEGNIKEKSDLFGKGKSKIERNTAKISELEEGLNEIKKVGSVCPICDNKLSDQKKAYIIKKRERNIEQLKEENRKLGPEIEKIKRQIGQLEISLMNAKVLKSKLEEFVDVNKEIKKLQNESKKLKSELKSKQKEKKMQEKALKLLQNKVDNLLIQQENIKNLISKRIELEQKIENIKDYKVKIEQARSKKELYAGFSPTSLERIETELQSMIGFEREFETRIEGFGTTKTEKEKLIQEIENKKKALEDYKLEIRKMDAISDQLQLFGNALVSTQEQLRKNFVTAVNQAMQSIWNDLYSYGDIYSIRLGIEEGDYVLQLQDSTGWIPADGVASGGERAMACLALRIAFALVLAPQLKWLVLDEPTHNLDSRAVEDLAKILRENVNEFIDQIFLITHDPSLETAVSGYLYRLERNKEKDDSTRVILVAGPD